MIDLTMSSLLPLLVSSVTATALTFMFSGTNPVFEFHLQDAFQVDRIPSYILLGVICGLTALYFTRTMNVLEGVFRKINGPYKKLLLGGVVLSFLIYLFPPSWRGVNDDWASYGLKTDGSYAPNLAIQGLFQPVADAKALEADGYKAVDWGSTLLKNRDEYEKYLFYDYDYVSAPIHYWPFTPNVLSNGGFTNGYGFKNE